MEQRPFANVVYELRFELVEKLDDCPHLPDHHVSLLLFGQRSEVLLGKALLFNPLRLADQGLAPGKEVIDGFSVLVLELQVKLTLLGCCRGAAS